MSKISIIMPCFLGEYSGGAKNRALKLNRAIQSFLNQDYEKKDLIIIADGCHTTIKFIKDNYSLIRNIKTYFIQKQELFSGTVRDFGLKIADGDYVAYLDSDDFFKSSNHLTNIVNGFKSNPNYDWLYFDDYVKFFALEHLDLTKRNSELTNGSIGVSNIAHKNHKEISWFGCDQYGHDFNFVSRLMAQYHNYKKIEGCSYVVCHIPNTCDS
jgi:glycosyltransferase involved in cell wall biosynthesis